MRSVLLALVLAGCGGQSFNISGYNLPIRDQLYLSHPTGYFCNGLAANQLLFEFVDYAPACYIDQSAGQTPYDPTRDHTSMTMLLALDGNSTWQRLNPFTFDNTVTCDGGGGNAIATFYHTPAGPASTMPDMTLQADSGSIRLGTYDSTSKNPATGDFNITFAGKAITGTFSAFDCD